MCPHEEKLTAWLLDDLSPEEHQAMTRHLETCDACRSAKEELSRVLMPLRSGLEKDRDLRMAARPQSKAAPLRAFFALWFTPQEGLKRVASLALFFGTLFVVIGVVYQKAHRPASSGSSDITYVSFLQSNEEPPPVLAPSEEAKSVRADKSSLAESPRLSEQLAAPSAPVVLPDVPAREPRPLPRERGIIDESVRQATRKAFVRAPAPASESQPALTVPDKVVAAKSERAKAAGVTPQHPAAGASLLAKPIGLAGASLASTNAVPTNATPTSAVMPAVRHAP